MVSDSEPRYRLVDSDGNVVGSFYAEADGTLKIQEGASGNDNEVSIGTDGTLGAPAVSTGQIDTGRTWQEVTTSRNFNAQETNDTNGEIKLFVYARANSDGVSVGLNAFVNTVRVDRFRQTLDTDEEASVQAISIPKGASYEVTNFGNTNSYSLEQWVEFRP